MMMCVYDVMMCVYVMMMCVYDVMMCVYDGVFDTILVVFWLVGRVFCTH